MKVLVLADVVAAGFDVNPDGARLDWWHGQQALADAYRDTAAALAAELGVRS